MSTPVDWVNTTSHATMSTNGASPLANLTNTRLPSSSSCDANSSPLILSKGLGSIGNLAQLAKSNANNAASRFGPNGMATSSSHTGWRPGHRVGFSGSASIDSLNGTMGLRDSHGQRAGLLKSTSPLNAVEDCHSPNVRSSVVTPQSAVNQSRPQTPLSRSASSAKLSSPKPHSQEISPRTRTWSQSHTLLNAQHGIHPASPIVMARHFLPSSSTSLCQSLSTSPEKGTAQAVSSAIFSNREPSDTHCGPSSPRAAGGGQESGSEGLSRNHGHRRAMTLPVLPGIGTIQYPQSEEVTGLPGRARLARPIESASPFAPSAVFSSSRGLSRIAAGNMKSAAISPDGVSIRREHPLSQTANTMDQQRQNLVAYEYLCHVAEAREWLETSITTRTADTPLSGPSIGDFEHSLRNGYALAHLARTLGGKDCQGPIYNGKERHFRHTVNINIFFAFVLEVGLPEIFRFETLDLYEAKNLPKVIYCIHALSHLLARRGVASRMNDLVGQISFTDAEVSATQKGLDDAGVRMPNFRGIGKALTKEGVEVDSEEVYAAAVEASRMEQERQQMEEAQARENEHRLALEAVALQHEQAQSIRDASEKLTRLQALVRGQAIRQSLSDRRNYLATSAPTIIKIQSTIRTRVAEAKLLARIRHFRSAESFLNSFQAHLRGNLARTAYVSRAKNLRKVDVVAAVGGLQSLARAALLRKRVAIQRQELGFVEPDVVGIQAHCRGWTARTRFLAWQDRIYDNEHNLVVLQSLLRGALARRRHFEVKRHFERNLATVVRLQAAIRSRRQGSQYNELRVGTNVSVDTVKNFVRLLDDSEFDYRGEIQIETLRKQLMAAIRDTQDLEDDVKDLDTKIALLVKNKITHEVARAQRSSSNGHTQLKRNSLLAAANDPFAATSLDRNTQRKLELYQQLFWQLQTQPAYLARLFANTARLGMSEKVQKGVETTTFVVFGYAQNQREEFLLLKLFQRSIHEELLSISSVSAFARGNFTFIRLLMQYGRGMAQRQYLKHLVGPQVSTVMVANDLFLGTDPIAIYRAEIASEETRTGRASQLPLDVDQLQALQDPSTNKVFVNHLHSLKKTTAAFLEALYGSLAEMPFGVRYVAREVYRALRTKFQEEPEESLIRIVGHLIYYRFIQPAVVAPETFDIIESGVSPIQRQNLGEVCKLLSQIAAGRLFGSEQMHLTPMNEFVTEASSQFCQWIYAVIDVPDVEQRFRTDEYLDAASSRRPVIYISPNDIYATHSIIVETLEVVAPDSDDPLRAVLEELGGVPCAVDVDLNRARLDEVALTLTTRVRQHEDPEADEKALFCQAKRRVVAILKIHHGANLEAVLARSVTEQDEEAWFRIVEEEEEEDLRQARAQHKIVVPISHDIRNLTFAMLKQATLGDILKLRQAGLVDRADKYQSLLNGIAQDIRSKHNRRVQRQNELQTMQGTLDSLRNKKRYLTDQKKSYHMYIDQSMASIQKKHKRRIVLPWSMQGVHQRSLDKAGKCYQFGSYKYTAQTLYDRGVLLSIDQYSPKQFDKISLTVSSDEVGIFEVSAAYLGLTVTTVELKLEELLESQFVGKQTVSIGGIAKANLNLLVHLINRKFYA